jgi:OmcA/MtrC family decaheme c-type cytochrome
LGGIEFQLFGVQNGNAGQNPIVQFAIKDKTGKPVLPSQMSRLALVLAGPTTDYVAFQTGYVSEDATKAECNSDATACWYTFKTAIPSNAKGSFSVGIEGRRTEKIYPGTLLEQSVQYGGVNKVLHFSVDGSAVAPRRAVVTTANCNKCHSFSRCMVETATRSKCACFATIRSSQTRLGGQRLSYRPICGFQDDGP